MKYTCLLRALFITTILSSCTRKEDSSTHALAEEEITAKYNLHKIKALSDSLHKNIALNHDTLATVKGWNGYNEVAAQVEILQNTKGSAQNNLRAPFNDFKNSIPAHLQLDAVQDAVEEIERELTALEIKFSKPGVSQKDRAAQIAKIEEAFSFLKNNIVQARTQFTDSSAVAQKAYLKELNNYNIHKTTAHELRAAAQDKK